mmetsp:Transcript_11392/g.11419  ORF Transcript_11392/g.11419 Transcript_11392/m.11419 type:complete len:164 (-) Transcript_11392:159-650(-)
MQSILRLSVRKTDFSPYRRRLLSLSKGFDILADNDSDRIFVTGYGDHSFQINDTLVRNSVILMPSSFLLWNCRDSSDITLEKLSIFPILIPTVEVLFIGCGDVMKKRIDSDIIEHFRSKGIIVEAMATKHAASTFNVLNSEGRNVAAALLTLKPNEIKDFTVD